MHQHPEQTYLLSITGGHRPSPRRDAWLTYLGLALFLVLFAAAGTSDYNAAVAERQATQHHQR